MAAAAVSHSHQGATSNRPRLMAQISLKDDDYFPSLNIPLRTPRNSNPKNERLARAAKAVQKGFFRQSSKYVLPGISAKEVEKTTYESGRLMMPDKQAVEGLKKQMELKNAQKKSKKNPTSVKFFKELQTSFMHFENIMVKHKSPSRSSVSRQQSFIHNLDTSHSNALKLALKEEQKFENKARGEEKRRKALKSSLEDLTSGRLSNRAMANVRVHQLKSLERSGSKENLSQSQASSDKNLLKPIKSSDKRHTQKRSPGRQKIKDRSRKPNSDSENDDVPELLTRPKLTPRETITKVQTMVRRIGPILVTSAKHRRNHSNKANQKSENPAAASVSTELRRSRRASLATRPAGERRVKLTRQSTTAFIQPKPVRVIKKLTQKDRRMTMANLPEFEAFANESDNRFLRMGDAREYFIQVIRKIMIVLCWWQEFSMHYQTMENQMKTFFDMAMEMEEETTRKHIAEATGISFDPKDYKASKEINLSFDIKKILTLPPHIRTLEQCQKVIAGLQPLKAFAEYPLHMQEKLAKVAWYQEVSPKRVILRQGHFAENFYFILSGFAVVKIIMKKKAGASLNVVARLSKGQSFGEIALLHHSQRTATVESGNHMTMLSIDRDDFLDIFFNMKDGEEPDHVTFCRQIPFLKNWPIERIHENPGTCMFHFFRRGSIVVPDSTKSEWIYIVKTGSCRILKRLDAVESERVWSSSHMHENDLRLQCRYGAIVYDPKVDDKAPESFGMKIPKEDRNPSPVGRAKTEFFTTKPREDYQRARSKSNVSFSVQREPTEDPIDEERSEDQEDDAGDEKQKDAKKQQEETDSESSQNGRRRSFKQGFSASRVDTVLTHRNRDPKSFKQNVPMIRRSNSSPERSYVRHAQPPHSTFIELRKLRTKDVFGLEDVQFEDEYYDNPNTSVMLVSDGSELIMLSRKLFIRYANEFVRQYVREHVKFFPSEDVLQENLQTQVNWDLFKSEELVSTLMEIHDAKSLKLLDSWA